MTATPCTVRSADGCLIVSGDMTIENADTLLKAGIEASASSTVFDLGAVAEIDSSGLAVLFGWQRQISASGRQLQICHAPANLISLADVYDVKALLPLS